MIPHLAGGLRFEQFPARRQQRDTGRARTLQVNQRPRVQPSPVRELKHERRQFNLAEGWIQKNDIERLPRQAQPCICVCLDESCQARNSRRSGRIQSRQLLAQVLRRDWRPLDEHHFTGAARQRLQPQGAGPGEQVQTSSPRGVVLQPIEQGLAHTVRRRAQALHIGELHPAPAPCPRDDADRVLLDGPCHHSKDRRRLSI
jgi:hypothetical protein